MEFAPREFSGHFGARWELGGAGREPRVAPVRVHGFRLTSMAPYVDHEQRRLQVSPV
jgi:hypothetical protein